MAWGWGSEATNSPPKESFKILSHQRHQEPQRQRLGVSGNRTEGYEEQVGPSLASRSHHLNRRSGEARVRHQTMRGLSQVFITKSKAFGSQDVRSCHQAKGNYMFPEARATDRHTDVCGSNRPLASLRSLLVGFYKDASLRSKQSRVGYLDMWEAEAKGNKTGTQS